MESFHQIVICSGEVVKKYTSRERSASAIGAYVRRQTAPVVSVVRSASELAAFRARAGRICVVAIVRDETTSEARALHDVLVNVASRLEDVLFALLVDASHDAQQQHIALLRTFDEPQLFYTDNLDADKVCAVIDDKKGVALSQARSSCAPLCLRIASRSWPNTRSPNTVSTSRWCFSIARPTPPTPSKCAPIAPRSTSCAASPHNWCDVNHLSHTHSLFISLLVAARSTDCVCLARQARVGRHARRPQRRALSGADARRHSSRQSTLFARRSLRAQRNRRSQCKTANDGDLVVRSDTHVA